MSGAPYRAGVRPSHAQNLRRTQPGLEQPQGQDVRRNDLDFFDHAICLAIS